MPSLNKAQPEPTNDSLRQLPPRFLGCDKGNIRAKKSNYLKRPSPWVCLELSKEEIHSHFLFSKMGIFPISSANPIKTKPQRQAVCGRNSHIPTIPKKKKALGEKK